MSFTVNLVPVLYFFPPFHQSVLILCTGASAFLFRPHSVLVQVQWFELTRYPDFVLTCHHHSDKKLVCGLVEKSIWHLLWASPNTIQRNPERVDLKIINRKGSAETPCSKTSRAQYVLWKVLANFLVFPVVFASMLTNTRSLLEKVQCSRVSMLVMLLFLLCLLHLALCSTIQ